MRTKKEEGRTGEPGLSMFVSREAAEMRTTGLALPMVNVEIKRTTTEAQQTLMLPHSR